MQVKEIVDKFTNKCFPAGQHANPIVAKISKKYGPEFMDKMLTGPHREKDLNDKELKFIKKYSKVEYGPLFYQKDNKWYPIRRLGDFVRIVYSDDPECKSIAKALRENYWAKGAHVALVETSSKDSKKHLEITPESTNAELPPFSIIMAESVTHRIFLGGEDMHDWMHGLEKRALLGAPGSQKLMEIMDKKKVKWCVFGWPIPSDKYFVPKEHYIKTFMASIEASFDPKLPKIIKYYKDALTNGNMIRITADDGTDLTFSIKGRPLLNDDGVVDEEDVKNGDVGLNIPAGELFLAPLETTANGKITFDYITTHGFGLVKNITLFFKDGKVVNWEGSKEDCENFKRFLDSNTGEKDRIAELGIGTNEGAQFVGDTIVDEKIFGSIHIAIGNNTGAYHGKNKASSHQDMIKIMHGKNGNMYIDGKLVMKDGFPIKKVY